MSNRNLPGIPKSLRFPIELYELIEKRADKDKKTFTDIVIERLTLTFEEDWDYTGKVIKLANREMVKWNNIKLEYKKIRHKQITQKRNRIKAKEEAKQMQKNIKDVSEFSKNLTAVTAIQKHLEGEMPIWVNDDNPDDWFSMENSPGDEYRKLDEGKLTDYLNEFYIEYSHLL